MSNSAGFQVQKSSILQGWKRDQVHNKGDVLFQIKESYEGINGSAAISSDDIESNQMGNPIQKMNNKIREMDSASQNEKNGGKNTISGNLGVLHVHPTQPNKHIKASGVVISRPKSK